MLLDHGFSFMIKLFFSTPSLNVQFFSILLYDPRLKSHRSVSPVDRLILMSPPDDLDTDEVCSSSVFVYYPSPETDVKINDL